MHCDLAWFTQWFNHYVDGFARDRGEERSLIELKRDHSLRVLENALQLTASIRISPHTKSAAGIAALLHDVGRFEQFDRYRTFNDRASVDHGRLGFSVLRREKVLEQADPAQRRTILLTVLMHNRRTLPRKLASDLQQCLAVVRDADKLDVFAVLLDHLETDGRSDPTVALDLPAHPTRYSSRILEQVSRGRMVNAADMAWQNDLKLLLASWVYDLNFTWTARALKERGLLERLFQSLPDTAQMMELKQRIGKELNKRAGV
ncbi:MAG: HD domain-containing protein [Desulfohalobiaceae bacterium]